MFSVENKFCDWHLQGFRGSQVKLFNELESTHTLMKQKAIAGKIKPGTLFVADKQTVGRGRHERSWESPAGKNLYFNILVPLKGIPLNRCPQITQVAALTFAEVFCALQKNKINNNCNEQITVKWPNDILYSNKKFCGILSEIVRMPEIKIETSTIALSMGVGINVNSDESDFVFLNRPVTSLKSIVGKKINREKLLQILIANLERAIGQFKAFGISPWVAAWKHMDKFIGSRGTIIINNKCTDDNKNVVQKKSGRILDMQSDGALLFECDDGKIETVYSADLEI